MDKTNDTLPTAEGTSSSFDRGYQTIRLPAHRAIGPETIRHAEDEDMFGDNIEAAAAPDCPSVLRRLKESV